MTYADKYALMKAYKIMTGEDPDQDKSPDRIEYDKKISSAKVQAIRMSIEKNNIPDSKVTEILNGFGYQKIEDIKTVDLMNVVNAFKEAK